MNRRQFLQALASVGASIALPISIAAATESQVDQAWQTLVKDPWYFDVNDYGTIEVAGVPDPKLWSDIYDLSPFTPRSAKDFISEVEWTRPLVERYQALVQGEVEELRWEIDSLEDELHCLEDDDDPAPQARVVAKKIRRLKTRLDRISDPEDGWREWLRTGGRKEVDRFWRIAQQWEQEKIDWAYYECLPLDWSAQGQAYRFFQDVDREMLDVLCIQIVEGDFPGSDYFAAELRCDVEEANRAALRLGLPFRFRTAA